MKFILEDDKLTIQEPERKNSGSINYYLVDLEHNSAWENLNIEARLTTKEGSVCNEEGRAIAVINNQVYIDNRLSGYYGIGFIGFRLIYKLTTDTSIILGKKYYTRSGEAGEYIYTEVQNPRVEDIGTYYEQLKNYQISSNLQGIFFNKGAGEILPKNAFQVPTEWEVYVAQIEEIANEASQSAEDAENSASIATQQAGIATSQAEEATTQAEISKSYAEESERQAEIASDEADRAEQARVGFEEEVQTATQNFNTNATNKTNEYNSNAQKKLDVYNQNDTNKTNTYNSNASDKLTAYNNNATDKLEAYNSNATEKTTAFNNNATQKTTDFNTNATNKTTSFNENATEKTGDYNSNAIEKTAEFNQNAQEKLDEFNEHAESYDERITELEEETESLRHDLNTATLDSTAEISDNVTLENTVSARFKKLVPLGRTKQESTTGKQLLPFTNQDFTVNGVRYYVQDGKLYLNGTSQGETPTTNSNFKNNFSFILSSGTYIFSKPSPSIPIKIAKKSNDEEIILNTSSELTRTFTLSEETEVYIGLYVYNRTFNNQTYDFMLEKGSTASPWEKYTGEISAPNQYYSQAINNVKRKNILEYSLESLKASNTAGVWNNNIYTYNGITYEVQEDLSIIANGTASSASKLFFIRSDGTRKSISAGNYIISGGHNSNSYIRIGITGVDEYKSTTSEKSITVSNDTTYYADITISAGTVLKNIIFYPMLRLASVTDNLYVPYNSMEVKIQNKNFFNINEVGDPYPVDMNYFIENNKISMEANINLGSQLVRSSIKNVKASKTYVVSFKAKKVVKGSENSSIIGRVYGSNDDVTYATIKDVGVSAINVVQGQTYSLSDTVTGYKFYRIFFYNNTGATVPDGDKTEYWDIQFEEGTTATTYEPHQEQILPFTLEEGQFLAKSGKLIDEGIYNDKSHVILDGASTGRKVTSVSLHSSGYYACVCEHVFDDGKPVPSFDTTDLLCTHFRAIGGVAPNQCYRTGTNGRIFVFVLLDQTITTEEQANAWLAGQYANGTPVIAEYPLANPTPTAYTETQQEQWKKIKKAMTYYGTTHISGIGNLNPNIEAIGIKDIVSVINNLDARLTLVEE